MMEQVQQGTVIETVGEPVYARLRAHEATLAALVTRLAAGDAQALAALYDATSALVYGLALRILRDPSAAEDVTLDVYTQVARQVTTYDVHRGTPSAWLVSMTRSRALDRLRHEAPRRARETSLDDAMALPAQTTGPEEASVTAERQRLVQTALAQLTPAQRHVLELAYYTGLSHTEIATHLGEPLGTIKTRLRTGLMRLRTVLQDLMPEA